MQEELEWWSEAGSLAGLSLTSPLSLSHTSPLSLSRTDQLPHGGREGFSLPPASSLSSLSYLQYSVSQPNPSKYPSGAASSASTSTGTYLKYRYRYYLIHFLNLNSILRRLLLPLLPTSLTIFTTTLTGLSWQCWQKHPGLLTSRQLTGDARHWS